VAQKGLGVALGSILACEVDVIATHATLRGSNWRSLKSKARGSSTTVATWSRPRRRTRATSRSSTWSGSRA